MTQEKTLAGDEIREGLFLSVNIHVTLFSLVFTV